MAFWTILSLWFRCTNVLLYIAVTYIIPVLLSSRTILQHDDASFVQWASYWIILYIWQCIEFVGRSTFYSSSSSSSSSISIVFFAWLSLRGGAMTVYGAVIYPLVHTYRNDIDQAISWIVRKVRMIILIFLASSAWSIIQNFLFAVRAVTVPPATTSSDGTTETTTQEHNNEQQMPLTRNTIMMASPYVVDFLTMLSKGIYVFSASEKSVIKLATLPSSTPRKKDIVYQLRIFAYNEMYHAFTLSSVERHEGVIRDTLFIHQILEISIISSFNDDEDTQQQQQQQQQTKSVITSTSHSHEHITNEECQLKIVLRDTSSTKDHRSWHDEQEDRRIVKLTCSSEEDRDTMLHGLQTCLPYLKQQRFSVALVSDNHEHNAAATATSIASAGSGNQGRNATSKGENNANADNGDDCNANTMMTMTATMAPSFKPSLVNSFGQTGATMNRSKARTRRRNRASY